jgi:hypothetical protein
VISTKSRWPVRVVMGWAMRTVRVVSTGELMRVRAVGPAGGATVGAAVGKGRPMACWYQAALRKTT